MPSILVIEHEGRYIERIRGALTAEGWSPRFVAGRPEALRAAASEAPHLVVVNAELPGAAELLRGFGRRFGGPGSVALVAEQRTPGSGAEQEADEVLVKPFSDQDLRLAVRRVLAAAKGGAGAAAEPPPPDGPERQLTSQDIFGDLLAEVEGEAGGEAAPFAAGPDAAQPAVAAAQQPSPPQPAPREPAAQPPQQAAAPAAAAAPARRAPAAEDDVELRLEKTLSGVFDAPRKPAPPPRPPAASEDVDELLNMTLLSLDLPAGLRGRPPRAAGPARGEAAAAPAAGGAASRSEPARRRGTGGVDLSELEALARRSTPRSAAPGPAGPQAAPAPQPPPQPPDMPPMPPPGMPPAGEPFIEPPEEVPPPPEPPSAPPEDVPEAPPPRMPPPAPEPGAPAATDELDDEPEVEAVAGAGAEPAAEAAPAAEAEPVAEKEPVAEAAPAAEAEPVAEKEPVAEAEVEAKRPAEVKAPAPAAEAGDGGRFGQYQLLDRIAVGGMAEVWKARMRGVEGFQKTVAIKRILPHMTTNSEFVDMFVDEAKLAAQLNHPNITHIYDLGKIEGDYYIAMEYVEGKNLREILKEGRRKSRPLPVGLALLVAARLASGLDHAHKKRDFDGRELGLVHRDVSPQNVLISTDGDIKLCDFGISKAVAKVSHTRTGALKGKLQYMSPEQAWGRPVDARSDVFSLGAILFEMLTGERLFAGDSEISVLEAVRECHVRSPRELNPQVPPAAEAVVMKALGREPGDRFASAGDLQHQLEAVLYQLRPAPSQSDLADYLRNLAEAPDAGETSSGAAAGARDERGAPEPSRAGTGAGARTGVDAGTGLGAGAGWAFTDAGAGSRAGAGGEGTDDGAEKGGAATPPAAASEAIDARRTGAPGTDATGTGVGAAAGAAASASSAMPVAEGTTAPRSAPPGAPGEAAALAEGTGAGPGAFAAAPAIPAADATGTGTAAPSAATPLAAPGDVEVEEGGGRGRWLLAAGIVLLVAAAVAGWLLFGPVLGGGEEPSAEAPAVTEPAPDAPGDAAGTAEGAPVPAAPAATGPTPEELEAMLDAELTRQEQVLEERVRSESEAKIRQLEAEIARIREAARQPPPPAEEPAAEEAEPAAEPPP